MEANEHKINIVNMEQRLSLKWDLPIKAR